uniref:ATP synthase complex subunit 8 n=1 Tax=Cyrtodactylus chanhomeae TaxID=1234020 RepID=A0A2Z6BF12_9SAUR|nr:ATP synthase F0 subunit 8 [Cyrtodactylus chanhomeae]
MPQLYPEPWFMTFISSWTILAILFKLTLNNISTSQPPNKPNKLTATSNPWYWTWQ